MKKHILTLFLSLYLLFNLGFANSDNNMFSLGTAIIMEAFVSIHMSAFVLLPLSKLISPENSKKVFWTLFGIRAGILVFFDLFITTAIAVVDFLAVFIGAFIIIPIYSVIKKTNPFARSSSTPLPAATVEAVASDDTAAEETGSFLTPDSFDSIYNNSEDGLLEEFIKRELKKSGFEVNNSWIPEDALKRKKILNIIFSLLLFCYLSLIFFHFPIYTYIIGFIILFIFYCFMQRYDFIKYLKKEIKSRPGEKISNIVIKAKLALTRDDSKPLFLACVIAAVILPMIIFMNPRILYEKAETGYSVRFYTFGLTNFTTATIPETHNGEPVVSLRGNCFSNMPFLESVVLPNTVTEIRGEAFLNDKRLTDVKLPKNLEEIKGNTFENCSSLTSIKIPDSVTRIGGHAFYGCSSLRNVTFTNNSALKEIGSSAFRRCTSLYSITLPQNVSINERAFKESPTNISYFD